MMDDKNILNLKNDAPVVQGDANAIETLNHSVDSHNVSNSHNTTHNYYMSESEEQKRAKNRTAYRDYCKSRIKNGLISPQLRRELDDYAFTLSLSAGEKQDIEQNVKESAATTTTLSDVEQMSLDFAFEQMAINSPDIKEQLAVLEPLVQKTDNDEVHYLYYLILAIENPMHCIKCYENRSCDNYWQCYWTFFAYLRTGMSAKANAILSELDKWHYSSDNIKLLKCSDFLYTYYNRNGSEDKLLMARRILQDSNSLFYLLKYFCNMLGYLASYASRPAILSDSPLCNFYLRLFEVKENVRPAQQYKPQPIASPVTSKQSVINEQVANIPPKGSTYTPNKPEKKKSPIWIVVLGIIAVIGIGILFFGESEEKKVVQSIPTESTAKIEETKVATNDNKMTASVTKNDNNTKKQVETSKKATTVSKDNTTTSSTAKATSVEKTSTATTSNNTAKVEETAVVEVSASEYVKKGLSAIKKFQDAKALEYFKQALLKGSEEANLYIGDIYYNGGNDIERNYPNAFAYYSKAANAGIAEGQYMFGLMYRNGQGCTKNIPMAKEWLRKAAAQGHEKAERLLNKL
jgi:hypothetical protein